VGVAFILRREPVENPDATEHGEAAAARASNDGAAALLELDLLEVSNEAETATAQAAMTINFVMVVNMVFKKSREAVEAGLAS